MSSAHQLTQSQPITVAQLPVVLLALSFSYLEFSSHCRFAQCNTHLHKISRHTLAHPTFHMHLLGGENALRRDDGTVVGPDALSRCDRITDDGKIVVVRPFASLPSARKGHAVSRVLNSSVTSLVVSGGRTDNHSAESAEVVRFDGNLGAWMPCPNMPNPRIYHASVAIGRRIYCIGGYGLSLDYESMDIFDTIANTWTAGPMCPFKLTYPMYTALGECIYLWWADVGLCYDTRTNTWRRLPSLPGWRYYGSAVAVSADRILILGGKEEYKAIDTVLEYNLNTFCIRTLDWTLPSERFEFSSWYNPYSERLYIVGGYPSRLCSNVYALHLRNCEVQGAANWQKLCDIAPRSFNGRC